VATGLRMNNSETFMSRLLNFTEKLLLAPTQSR
jgi:hypothetical protein